MKIWRAIINLKKINCAARLEKELRATGPSDLKVPAHKYQILVERGLKSLSVLERRALSLRFWQPYTIAQVADRMKLSWEEADRLIDIAVFKVRAVIRKHLNNSDGGLA